jgi:predicted nuclease of predicted toxin-antitoxin system
MKLLFDQNISYRIVAKLQPFFEQCKQVTQVGLANSTDIDIWQYAFNNGFTIVTFDADFYDISLLNGYPPKIIWIRTGNMPTAKLADMLIAQKDEIVSFAGNQELACLEIK